MLLAMASLVEDNGRLTFADKLGLNFCRLVGLTARRYSIATELLVRLID